MSGIKLKELLKHKKPGDEWYSLHAPEELQFWKKSKPWKKGTFSKRGVRPLAINVRASGEGGKDKQSFTLKNPMILKCGVEVTGTYTTKQSIAASLKCRIDSTVEFNQVMQELTNNTKFDFWEISKLIIYNPNEGVECEFKIHNPDSSGSGLYLYRIHKDKTTRLYPNVMLHDQQKYVDKFSESLAHCTAKEVTEMVHSCGKHVHKRQIKKVKGGRKKK